MITGGRLALAAVATLAMVGAAFSIVAANGDDDTEAGDKILICHVPPGNPDNAHTIEISAAAWPAHEAHGDYRGGCHAETGAGSDDDDEDDADDDGADEADDEEGDDGDEAGDDEGDDAEGGDGGAGDDDSGDAGDDDGHDGNETGDDDGRDEDEGEGGQPEHERPDVPECEEQQVCEADVALNKTADVRREEGANNDRVDYTFVVTSLGEIAAENVTLDDELPDFGGRYVLGGPDGGDCTIVARTLHCEFGDLNPGETRKVFADTALCNIECGEDVVNTATVHADNDSDESNNQDSAVVEREPCPEPEPEPEPAPDVGVEKDANVTDREETGKDQVEWVITVSSLGNGTATNVSLSDELPDIDGAEYTLGGPDADDCMLVGLNLTCDFGDLDQGETRTVTATTELCEIGCGEDIVNTAKVSADNDTNPENDQDSASVDREDCPVHEPDAAVTKDANVTDSEDSGADTVEWIITVESIGSGTVHNVTLYDELPDIDGAGYTLGGADADDCSLDGLTLTCAFGDLDEGEIRTVTASTGLCEIGCGEDIVNNATISADDDVDGSNDSDSASVARDDCPEPDASVEKEGSISEPDAQGFQTVSWNITVESIGTGTVENVTLVDELPDVDGADYVLSGDDADDCTLVGLTLTCEFGDLAPGEIRNVVATTEACDIDCGGDLENTARITSANDTDASNDSATAIVERPDCP